VKLLKWNYHGFEEKYVSPCFFFTTNFIMNVKSTFNFSYLNCYTLELELIIGTELQRITKQRKTGLLAAAALGFLVRRWGEPSVSGSICRVAVLGGSPRQLILSQSSQSGLWYGRQQRNTQILVYLLVTYVPWGTINKTKTLGL